MNEENKRYIYNLPISELKACCRILDENNLWEELGVHMGYDRTIIQVIHEKNIEINELTHQFQEVRREINCGKSPSEKLLTLWGNLNHTVLELFVLLDRMKNFQTMNILKKFISPNNLIYFQLQDNNNHEKIEEDLSKSQKILNVSKPPVDVISRENNQSMVEVGENFNQANRLLQVSSILH